MQNGRGHVTLKPPPRQTRQQRHPNDHGHEDAADLVHQTLHGRFERLGRFHQPHDARQGRFGPHRRGAQPQQAVAIDGSTRHTITWLFEYRQAFTREQGFVHLALAF